MSETQFVELVGKVANAISGAPLDEALEARLNSEFAANSDDFVTLSKLCAQGEAEGWLMSREMGGIKFGRAVKPGTAAAEFSVDVVRMKDVAGPHHIHTNGEIGAIFPIEGVPRFDGRAEGWYVYGAGSEHHPTVSGGDAYILYLLPEGAIEFTGK